MARRYRSRGRSRRRGRAKMPVALKIGLGAGAMVGIGDAIGSARTGGIMAGITRLGYNYTGLNFSPDGRYNGWEPHRASFGWIPVVGGGIAGWIGHKLAGMSGINRYLPRAWRM